MNPCVWSQLLKLETQCIPLPVCKQRHGNKKKKSVSGKTVQLVQLNALNFRLQVDVSGSATSSGRPTLKRSKTQLKAFGFERRPQLNSSTSRSEEKHGACLCVWILPSASQSLPIPLPPLTCLGFDFLTYSLAAFLLQCSALRVLSPVSLCSSPHLIPRVLPGSAGSQPVFHKDNTAELTDGV